MMKKTPSPAVNFAEEFQYNAGDVIATAVSFDRLAREGAVARAAFDHAMLGVALTMNLRGLRVDELAVSEVRAEVHDAAKHHQRELKQFHDFKFGRGIKPSAVELIRVLYTDYRAPLQLSREGKPTGNKEALVKLIESKRSSDEVVAIAEHALELSRLEEDRKVLDKPRGSDGRFYTSHGVAADVTSRWNSKKSAFNDGGNTQAMSRRLRRIFIADEGKAMFAWDQEQAESYYVACRVGSRWYREAHESGNVHMLVGSKLWPGVCKTKDEAKHKPLPWNQDMSYYDLFKRRQHAGNYGQTPYGFSRIAHIPLAEATKSHNLYFKLIPEVAAWHAEVKRAVRDLHRIVTPMGRVRQFLGRTWDESTMKEAIAHEPQSVISDINKVILFRIWRDLDPALAEVLLEIHDGGIGQCDVDDVAEVTERVRALARVEVPLKGDQFIVPVAIQTGANWGDYDGVKNLAGLRDYKPAAPKAA